jgi:tRNA (guanine10-N2)-dimethyltransferase
MKWVVHFSGEHPSLPRAELEAVLEGESIRADVEYAGRLAIADTDTDDPSFLGRLAYALKCYEWLGEGPSLDSLAGPVYDAISDAESFRVSGPSAVQERLGGLLHGFGLKVDLKSPQAEVAVYERGGGYLAAAALPVARGYEGRRAQYRPFFRPTSMHPKLARALVNLARTGSGDTVLDPFCGTGGILIEAGLMGMGAVGWDVDPNMVEGCVQNLGEYGLSGEISVADALMGEGRFDAIATDPPYGRASRASEEASGLYRKFAARARGLLDGGAYMCLMLPHDRRLDAEGFGVCGVFDVRMHRSLTRRIWVLKAI